ncbi:MAG TPA: hypothetical protein VGS79_04665 [Puia sp.]|nr:hypothetical protein [Puia sp.]
MKKGRVDRMGNCFDQRMKSEDLSSILPLLSFSSARFGVGASDLVQEKDSLKKTYLGLRMLPRGK